MIYDITLTVVDSSTSTTHAGAAVSIEVLQVVGQVNTGSSITDGDKGDITVSGSGATWTINDSGVEADTYGSASAIPVITVDEKGRIISATTQAPASGGSRRILAATLTFTGASTGVEQTIFFPAVTGSLPDPATVLPGGTLQSIELEYIPTITSDATLDFTAVPTFQPFGVCFKISAFAGVITVQDSIFSSVGFVPSAGTTSFATDALEFRGCTTFRGSGITFPRSLSLMFQAYVVISSGAVLATAAWNTISVTGTIKAYYMFE